MNLHKSITLRLRGALTIKLLVLIFRAGFGSPLYRLSRLTWRLVFDLMRENINLIVVSMHCSSVSCLVAFGRKQNEAATPEKEITMTSMEIILTIVIVVAILAGGVKVTTHIQINNRSNNRKD